MMRPEFATYALNEEGSARLLVIGENFSRLIEILEALAPPGREMALARTKLEEAASWAMRAVATHSANQAPREN